MLNSMLFVMIAGAVLFMILSIKWDSLVFGILDVFLWFIIAAAVHSIEIPYVAITSSDAIVTGYHEIQDLFYLKTLFVGIGRINENDYHWRLMGEVGPTFFADGTYTEFE